MDSAFARPNFFNWLKEFDEVEGREAAFAPNVNIEETKEAFVLAFDLPGVKKEDLKIDVNGRTLRISGERKREAKKESQGFSSYECHVGKFSRGFTLPEGVDAGRVDATLTDGVLTVVVPKSEAEKPRTIEIK
jgi:HSP20 family protein